MTAMIEALRDLVTAVEETIRGWIDRSRGLFQLISSHFSFLCRPK